ncbi:MAG: DUF5674 family protein [bacterium]
MDKILIIDKPIKFSDIEKVVSWHSDYIKGVADIKNQRLSFGGSLHADGEQKLLEELDVDNEFLWGFNFYPNKEVEYESLINIKPRVGNKSIFIASEEIKKQVNEVIFKLILF